MDGCRWGPGGIGAGQTVARSQIEIENGNDHRRAIAASLR
jgi:hypothetical protein